MGDYVITYVSGLQHSPADMACLVGVAAGCVTAVSTGAVAWLQQGHKCTPAADVLSVYIILSECALLGESSRETRVLSVFNWHA